MHQMSEIIDHLRKVNIRYFQIMLSIFLLGIGSKAGLDTVMTSCKQITQDDMRLFMFS